MGELAVRLLWGNPPDLLDKSDPVLGSRYFRGITAERRVDNRRVPVVINAQGFHSPPVTPRQPGQRRLLFLGDSFTGATEVELASTFHQLAAANLSRQGPPTVAYSLGVSGFGTAQELLAWRQEGPRCDADTVILVIFVGNDIADNEQQLNGGRLPTFTVAADGALQALPFTPRWSKQTGFIRNSALYKWQKTVTNRAIQNALRAADALPRYEVYRAPSSPAWRHAWQVTTALLRALRDEVRQAGADLRVVLLPEEMQVNQVAWEALLTRYPKLRETTWDLGYPQRRLAAELARWQVPVLDVQGPFRTALAHQRLYNLEEPHLNPAGHRLLGHLIAQWLSAPTRPPAAHPAAHKETPPGVHQAAP
ncbi:MAG: SGNH/GDSL hydrolase family protein [Fimbriimonadaceae bacterium]|nr:SGNH/GDSL hydrolase family protein [Fimbriimonadaceae bacterium]